MDEDPYYFDTQYSDVLMSGDPMFPSGAENNVSLIPLSQVPLDSSTLFIDSTPSDNLLELTSSVNGYSTMNNIESSDFVIYSPSSSNNNVTAKITESSLGTPSVSKTDFSIVQEYSNTPDNLCGVTSSVFSYPTDNNQENSDFLILSPSSSKDNNLTSLGTPTVRPAASPYFSPSPMLRQDNSVQSQGCVQLSVEGNHNLAYGSDQITSEGRVELDTDNIPGNC